MVSDAQIMYWVVGLGISIVGGLWLYMESKFKLKVIMKDIVQGRTVVREYRASEHVDKDKSIFWKLGGEKNKERKLIPLPPAECIDINHKGKKIVHAYRFPSGEIVYCKDDWKMISPPVFDIDKETLDKFTAESNNDPATLKALIGDWKKKQSQDWQKANKVIAPYQPVTTQQRMSYFYNIKKAEERKKFNWKEHIVPITAMGALVIIVLGLFIFWGEIAKPALEADKIAERMQQTNMEMLQILRDIKQNQQTIQGVRPG